ncbi:hypothetical protein RI367_005965 [Sorochytrium milnesiophthora]
MASSPSLRRVLRSSSSGSPSAGKKRSPKALRKVLVEKCRRQYKLHSARELVSHFQSYLATSMASSVKARVGEAAGVCDNGDDASSLSPRAESLLHAVDSTMVDAPLLAADVATASGLAFTSVFSSEDLMSSACNYGFASQVPLLSSTTSSTLSYPAGDGFDVMPTAVAANPLLQELDALWLSTLAPSPSSPSSLQLVPSVETLTDSAPCTDVLADLFDFSAKPAVQAVPPVTDASLPDAQLLETLQHIAQLCDLLPAGLLLPPSVDVAVSAPFSISLADVSSLLGDSC